VAVTDPFSELVVHHEVVDVFLGASQLQLASKNGHHKRRTPGTLHTHTHTVGLPRWLTGLVVSALDLRLDGRQFDSQPPRLILGWVTVFGGQTTSAFHRATQANSASYPQRDGK